METVKNRKGFVTFWLWLIIIANAAATIFKFVDGTWAFPHIAYATAEKADLFFFVQHNILQYYHYGVTIVVCCGIANALCGIMLLKWLKLGFWGFIISNTLILITMLVFANLGGATSSVILSMIGSVVAPIILYAVLQIPKDGVSSWSQLK